MIPANAATPKTPTPITAHVMTTPQAHASPHGGRGLHGPRWAKTAADATFSLADRRDRVVGPLTPPAEHEGAAPPEPAPRPALAKLPDTPGTLATRFRQLG